MDDENLSLSEIAKRFKIYAESARLTDSMPIILVTASDGVPGERLVEVLEVLYQTGIRHINVPNYRDPETKSTGDSSPQIQGQPYRVELR